MLDVAEAMVESRNHELKGAQKITEFQERLENEVVNGSEVCSDKTTAIKKLRTDIAAFKKKKHTTELQAGCLFFSSPTAPTPEAPAIHRCYKFGA